MGRGPRQGKGFPGFFSRLAGHKEEGLPRFADLLGLSDGGAEGIRTPDPHNAIVVLYQLSYDPIRKRDRHRREPGGGLSKAICKAPDELYVPDAGEEVVGLACPGSIPARMPR
ncbi:MAG: hypothetical protein RJA22_2490 [Verrucomicrobiota bacterium]